MLRAIKTIYVWPDTKQRFKKKILPGETADRALNRLMTLEDNLKEDMEY